MADDILTLSELVTINDMSVADIEVTDIFDDAPFLAAMHSATASNGTVHKYLKETGAPVVGFRDANAGRDHDVSEDTLVSVILKILDASHHQDVAIARAFKEGPEGLAARESRRHLKAAFKHAEKQLINGTGNDADGFDGLADVLDELSDAMVIGNGGSVAVSQTSVYMVRTTSDESQCTVIMGQDGNIQILETFHQMVEDGSAKKFPAQVTPITGWLGLQVGSAQSIARLANVDLVATLDDDALSNLFELFPEEAPPTHIIMNKRARKQLQQSRTATSPSGAPAPWPMQWEDIPIISTSSITNTEAVVT